MSLSLWTALAAVSTAYAACDNSQVFALPVKDVSLSNGKLMRGVPISAGTPSQSFAVVPQAHFDDTILYTKSSCACASNATSATCVILCGGLYDQQTSSSSSTIDQDPGNDSIVGDDLLIGNSSLSDYPIVLPITEWGPTGDTVGSLGVSPNSTLLNALLTAGKIASRSYSWWWGVQTSTNLAATDGQLVLGEFDAAKMQGSQYSFPLVAPTQDCASGMVMSMTDMTLNFPNGTSASMLSPFSLQACIMPDAPLIAYIPQTPYFKTFQALTGTSNVGADLEPATLNYQGMLFPQSNVYKGNLTISINNEIAFEFPNDQLVLPNANVQADGSILADQAAPELLLGSVPGPSSGWAVLGRSFFQAAYLTVNYDAGNFTISQVDPSSTETNLVAVGQGGAPCSTASSDQGTGDTSNSGADYTSGYSSGGDGQDGFNDAVIGTAVGGFLFILIVVGVLWFCIRRRRRRRRAARAGATLEARKRSGDVQLDSMTDLTRNCVEEAKEADSVGVVELHSEWTRGELGGEPGAYELHSPAARGELAAESNPLELPVESHPRTKSRDFLHGQWPLVELE